MREPARRRWNQLSANVALPNKSAKDRVATNIRFVEHVLTKSSTSDVSAAAMSRRPAGKRHKKSRPLCLRQSMRASLKPAARRFDNKTSRTGETFLNTFGVSPGKCAARSSGTTTVLRNLSSMSATSARSASRQGPCAPPCAPGSNSALCIAPVALRFGLPSR